MGKGVNQRIQRGDSVICGPTKFFGDLSAAPSAAGLRYAGDNVVGDVEIRVSVLDVVVVVERLH